MQKVEIFKNTSFQYIKDAPDEGVSVIVTPQMASKWLCLWGYNGQRALRQWHCNNLALMMQEGKFRSKTQIAFMRVADKYYLTNGQHTLSAIVQSGIQQELSIVVNVGSSMEDVADDFARHDTHLTRQFATSLVAHAVHEELGVTPTTLNLVTAASIYYAFMIGEVQQKALNQITHDSKLAIVRKYGPTGVTALGFFDGVANCAYLTRRTTVASAMFCTAKNQDMAEQFFRTMALDDGLRRGDPRKTLLEWLRSHGTAGGNWGKKTIKSVATDHEAVKSIATSWNAWMDGRDLLVIRVNHDDETVHFKGVGKAVVRNIKRRME